ncbi:MAG: hypothetical protein DMD35_00560 [Gemmatimonadetes bacterium]|nr:MAG: hypothetical protein DMD35_00560 [Gemmatimonadota bacterium]
MLAAFAPRVAAVALAALPIVACWSGSTSIPTPAPVATTTLLTRLGADTLAVEQYTRTTTHMVGTLVTRLPATRIARYTIDLARSGAPVKVDLSVRDGSGAPLPGGLQSLSVRFGRDSAVLTGHRSASDTTRAFVVRGPVLPALAMSFGLYELALARMSLLGRDSVEFASVPIGLATRQATPQAVRVVGRDSVRVTVNGSPLFVRHDGHGGIVAVDGAHTTFKVLVTRIDSLDVEPIAHAWSQREQGGTPAGPASTRDTVQATVGSAHLWIDYGRPALRGRDVWVNGVLGDTLWRTGANAATQFRTDVDLVVGGATVPAGTYTLWTATTPSGYQLAINRQVGQWGTVYDSKRDLVRVPLRESSVAAPVERFTIDVEQGNPTASLNLTWGTKRLSVPLSAK